MPIVIICFIGLIFFVVMVGQEVNKGGSKAKTYFLILLILCVIFGIMRLCLNNLQIGTLSNYSTGNEQAGWYKNLTLVDKPNGIYYLNMYFIDNLFGTSLLFSIVIGIVVYIERIEKIIGRSVPFEDFILRVRNLLQKDFTSFWRESEIEEKDHKIKVFGKEKEILEAEKEINRIKQPEQARQKKTEDEKFEKKMKRIQKIKQTGEKMKREAKENAMPQSFIDNIDAMTQQEIEKIK